MFLRLGQRKIRIASALTILSFVGLRFHDSAQNFIATRSHPSTISHPAHIPHAIFMALGLNLACGAPAAALDASVNPDLVVPSGKSLLGVVVLFWVAVGIASAFDNSPSHANQPSDPRQKFLASIKGSYAILKNRHDVGAPSSHLEKVRWGLEGFLVRQVNLYNRADVEHKGYFLKFLPALEAEFAGSSPDNVITFYDTMTGKPLFNAPQGRSWEKFIEDSKQAGRLAFRDAEVVTDNVRIVGDYSMVSVDGTNLGTNEPDLDGNRYCISICSVAGLASYRQPSKTPVATDVAGVEEELPVPV